jgi:MFS family permease
MSTESEPQKKNLPSTARQLLAFQAFNAFNFTLALGAPVVLTARYIGASETEIGLLNSLMPLLVVLQVVGTTLIDRFGYRRTMIAGWGLRSFALLIIVPLPFLVGRVSTDVLVGLMLLAMFIFTMIRGLASAAWFPWLSVLLPTGQRGNYFGLEQQMMNVSAFAALMLSGWFLGSNPEPWQYSALFLGAWGAGMGSALVLWSTPETGAGLLARKQRARPRDLLKTARNIWAYKPFRKTTMFVCAYTFAMMAQPVFLVLYVREELALSEGLILKFQAAATLGVLVSAVFWGRLSDRIGSRPLLRLCDIGIFATVFFWLLSALGFFRPTVPSIFLVYFIGGVFTAAHAVSQSRLLLGCSPPGTVTIALALFQVGASVCGGAAPVLFGFVLEHLRGVYPVVEGSVSTPFTVLFGSFLLLGIFSQFLLSRVPEPRRVPTRHVLLRVFYGWPMRILSGFIPENGNRKP